MIQFYTVHNGVYDTSPLYLSDCTNLYRFNTKWYNAKLIPCSSTKITQRLWKLDHIYNIITNDIINLNTYSICSSIMQLHNNYLTIICNRHTFYGTRSFSYMLYDDLIDIQFCIYRYCSHSNKIYARSRRIIKLQDYKPSALRI